MVSLTSRSQLCFLWASAGLTPRRALFSTRRHAEMGRIGQAPLSTLTLQRAPPTQETFSLPRLGVAMILRSQSSVSTCSSSGSNTVVVDLSRTDA
jgi:hypothetical protein